MAAMGLTTSLGPRGHQGVTYPELRGAAEKLLGGTLHSLAAHAMGQTMDLDTLHKARQSRNWIAHEGASIGDIWSVSSDRIHQHAVKLRAAVTDLALGDNVISQWCHGLAEPHELPPTDWINGYPRRRRHLSLRPPPPPAARARPESCRLGVNSFLGISAVRKELAERAENGGVVDVARRDDDSQGQAPAVAGKMNLRGQPAAGPAQRLASRRVCRIFRFVSRRRPFCGHRRRAGEPG